MRKFLHKKTIVVLAICSVIVVGLVVGFVIWRTKDRVQVEINIHINQNAIYMSTYSEPPQFAVWLENPRTEQCQQVFVTYRASRGDWEGKVDVPALPRWKDVFRNGGTKNIRSDEEIAISGATPKDEYFRVRAEVTPGSQWICWIEMNLAGDYNEFYPQFNSITLKEDEFAIGQPALLYRAEIKAEIDEKYVPELAFISFGEEGDRNRLAQIDTTITTAKNVFDEISIVMIKPKPVIINKNKKVKQNVIK